MLLKQLSDQLEMVILRQISSLFDQTHLKESVSLIGVYRYEAVIYGKGKTKTDKS